MWESGIGICWYPPNIATSQSLIIGVGELIFHDPISEDHMISHVNLKELRDFTRNLTESSNLT